MSAWVVILAAALTGLVALGGVAFCWVVDLPPWVVLLPVSVAAFVVGVFVGER